MKSLPACILCVYLILLGGSIFRYVDQTQPVSFGGAPEEQILELTAAKNFVKYGFFTHLLLPDYATSPDLNDHPYLYSHMPSGPSVFLGLLLKLGISLLNIRLIFGFISVMGVVALYLFAETMFENSWVALAGAVTLSFSYIGFMVWSDHFVHAFHWLSLFSVGYFFLKYVKRPRWYYLAGSLGFLTVSLSTSFISLVSIFILVGSLYIFKFRQDASARKLVRILYAYSTFFVLGLVFRNMAALGPSVAIKELAFTITNRIAGYPHREDLKSFFQANNLALWGANNYRPEGLIRWFGEIFNSLRVPFNIILIALAFFYFGENPRLRTMRQFLIPTICLLLALISWYIIFSAHAQNYILPFVAQMVLATVAMAAAASLKVLWEDNPNLATWKHALSSPKRTQIFLLLLVVTSFMYVDFSKRLIRREIKNWTEMEKVTFYQDRMQQFIPMKDFTTEVIWTNLNSITLSYFSPSKIVGTCTAEAFNTKDISGCFAVLINNAQNKLEILQKPTLYLVSRVLVSADLFETEAVKFNAFLNEQNKKYEIIAKSEDWTLFRVAIPKEQAARLH